MGRNLLEEPGINWIWYYEFEIIDGKCKLGNSWRAHKFEDRGPAPKSTDTIHHGQISMRDVNIGLWISDGRPGGIDGLKALYRMPPTVRIGDQVYPLYR